MAGVLVADTLMDGAGNSTAMDNAIYGSAKAWVTYNGVGQSIRASYNVSSVTYVGTGNYTINFTNAMTDANYCAQVNNQPFGDGYGTSCNIFGTGYNTAANPSTSSFSICTYHTSGGASANSAYVCAVVYR